MCMCERLYVFVLLLVGLTLNLTAIMVYICCVCIAANEKLLAKKSNRNQVAQNVTHTLCPLNLEICICGALMHGIVCQSSFKEFFSYHKKCLQSL